jgi:hypothetical protein
MASMGMEAINLPDTPDDHSAAAEAYDRAISANLNHESITDYFLDLIGTALMESHNALADMRTLLTDAPLQDGYDLQQWARIGQPSDASLAHLVRKLYGQAHLAEVERIRGQLGDVAF